MPVKSGDMAEPCAKLPWNIGTYVAARLVQLGVQDYFAVPGDYNLVLLDQLLLNPELRMVNCCNELNAGYAADGYARARGLGALFVTFTVGGLSALNAVAGACSDDLPLVVVSGAPNSNDFGTERILHHTIGLANFEQQLQCFKQVCCHTTTIMSVETGSSRIDTALATCLRERKPVCIEICCNIAAVEHYSCAPPRSEMVLGMQVSNDKNLEMAVDAILQILNNAVKPVLVAGRGLRAFDAKTDFLALADASGYAWASMPDAKGMLPESHPCYIGTYWGAVSSPVACEMVESADIYMFVGPRFNDYTTTGYSLLVQPTKMIEIREREVIVANQGTFHCINMRDVLSALAKRIKKNDASFVNYQRMFVPAALPPNINQQESRLTTNVLFYHIQNMLTCDTAIIAETGDSWFNGQKLKLPEGCQYEFQMQYGSIGWSVGATLGMACGLQGQKRVISLIGDGSFQMTAQEVSTMLRFALNNIIFLINNNGYTIEVEIHDGPYNNIQMWDYCGVVNAFNNGTSKLYTKKAETEGDLIQAIAATKQLPDTLCFIECVTARDDCSKELLEWGARVAAANARPPAKE
eukprot:TRINITY_DN41865_c0_g1_i1.p1 TRINITY_DN41865_c0_g1~~TRINITY_DN41865_c0_g1_i1.p1  ORF type:complete len:581 (-),score=109.98 TRINITY_DN41865_c0_g1_i1:185-1927(-)